MGRRVVMAMGRCVLCMGHRCPCRQLLVRRDAVLLMRRLCRRKRLWCVIDRACLSDLMRDRLRDWLGRRGSILAILLCERSLL